MDVDNLLSKATESVTVGRAFGPPIERDGTLIIPVAGSPGEVVAEAVSTVSRCWRSPRLPAQGRWRDAGVTR